MNKETPLETSKSLKMLVGASFIVLATTIVSKFLTYLYRIVIARFYTPEIYGIYSLSIMIIGWVMLFAGIGLAGGLTRYLPYYRGKKEEAKASYLFRKTTLFLSLSGILGFIIVILTSGFISNNLFHLHELKSFLIIFSFAIPFSVLAGAYFSALKSYEKIGWFAFIVNVLQNTVKLLVLVVLIFLGLNSNSIAISYVVGVMTALLTAYIITKRKIPSLFKRNNVKDGKDILNQVFSYSCPLIFFGFISSLLSWTDIFMIGILKTPVEVGFYNAAVPIALIITLSTDLFRQMFLPLISKEYGKGNLFTVKEISRQVTKWLFAISIPLFVALFIFPNEAIKILFGPEYLPAAGALRILIFGFLIASVLDVSPEILSMKGKSKLILKDIIIVAVLNLILNYLLIPLYGINGAAISTTISLFILSILFTYQSWKETSIFIIKKDVIKIIICGGVSFATALGISFYLETNAFVKVVTVGVAFLIIYLSTLLLSRSVDSNDYLVFEAIRNKLFKKCLIEQAKID